MGNPQQNRQLQGAYLQQQRHKEQEQRLKARSRARSFYQIPASETCYESVGYTYWTRKPNERKIAQIVKRYAQEGWRYVARREDDGFFGVGASTILMFQR